MAAATSASGGVALALFVHPLFVYGQVEPAVYQKHVTAAQMLVASKGADYDLDTTNRAKADTPHNLADGVVKLEARQLRLAPVFADVAPGKYRLEFKAARTRSRDRAFLRAFLDAIK